MVKCIEGIFRNGTVELLESPGDLTEARVLVTFLPNEENNRKGPQMTPQEVAELRWRLQSWESDWNAPGMEAYDEM